jgi:hypothetical protein
MACCILKLRVVERRLIWGVDTSILNKQSRTAEMVCSSSVGFGLGAKSSHFRNELFCELTKQ